MQHFFDADPFNPDIISLHWRASAIREIWPGVLFFTAFAAAMVIIKHVQSVDIGVESTILTVFGTILGFVISYRTSSAYDRYWEGRKMWSDIVHASRTLARMIWLHLPNYINAPKDPNNVPEEEVVKALLEKKTMINLIEAFAVATKHYLRGEDGPYYEDLWHLIAFLPKYHLPSSVPVRRDLNVLEQTISNASVRRSDREREKEKEGAGKKEKGFFISRNGSLDSSMILKKELEDLSRSSGEAEKEKKKPDSDSHQSKRFANGVPLPPEGQKLLPATNPPPFSILEDVLPFLIPVKIFFNYITKHYKKKFSPPTNRRRKRRRAPLQNENIPLEITVIFSSYIAAIQRRKVTDVPTLNSMLAAVLSMGSSLSALERILTTPIPAGYAIHLKHIVWIYLFVLPFQLINYLNWITVPATGILSFMLLGLLEIGTEIENPFGYDHNDLNLDYFCSRIIHRELTDLTAHTPESQAPESFVFSKMNVPFHQVDPRNAEEIIKSRVKRDQIDRTLSRMELYDEDCDSSIMSGRQRSRDAEMGDAGGFGDAGVGGGVGGGTDAGDG